VFRGPLKVGHWPPALCGLSECLVGVHGYTCGANAKPRAASLHTSTGLVSLSLLTAPVFGPPHMHPTAPALAHFVGDTSPQSHPALYVSCIKSLYAWYREHTGAAEPEGRGPTWPPLVVNTHGWIKARSGGPKTRSACGVGVGVQALCVEGED
jgi:mRNA cleavage and polyadenylation factor CLP1 P-loop